MLLIVLSLPKIGLGQSKKISLVTGWAFCNEDSNLYYPATVPGSLVSDLTNVGIISNPFIGDNASEVQWIGDKSWSYRTSFNIDKVDFAKFGRAELIFEGIDTYASVYLNDTLIYQADNMFVRHLIEVKKWLKIGKNKLRVVFPPLIPLLKNRAKQLPYTLPENERVFARKAQFHFGWDWAPKVLAPAIFKPVSLNLWNSVKVNPPVVIASLNHGSGTLTCKIPVSVATKRVTDLFVKISDEITHEVRFQKVFRVIGDSLIGCDFKVDNPKIWSPSGVGIQNLYHYKVTVTTPKGEKFESLKQVGFREVLLVQTPDSIGSSFYFKVNGLPVFAKGANWVPMEYLPHLNTPEKYRKLIGLAKDAGYNMLRVWGGGWYEDDIFYDLCDSLGIMVWQDAMFACAMYPSDEAYLKNVSKEIRYQSKRLSSHPSVVLWCGNNENYEGWYNWGWQKQLGYSAADSTAIWNGNRQLFETVIPQALKETYGDIGFNYHPSSPANGWGRDTAYKSGDVHYWGVWWGMEPFSSYWKKVGRFVSEYGFQGYSSIETLRYGAGEAVDSLNQRTVAAHQKHARGYQTIDEYMQRDYPKPTTVEDYIYISQLMQADGMGEAIKAHTQHIPYCMGSLFWQFNDCWSSISWAAVDYFGNPKSFYYASKRLFKPVKPTFVKNGDTSEVWVSNSSNETFDGKLVLLEVEEFGARNVVQTTPISVSSNQSAKINIIVNSKIKSNSVLAAMLIKGQTEMVTTEVFFMDQPKNLKLKKPTISFSQSNGGENSINLIVSTDVPIKGLWLNIEGFELSDNGFDMIPGIDNVIFCKPIRPTSIFSVDSIKTISLNDVLNR